MFSSRGPQQELQKASKRAPREATMSLRSGPGGARSDPSQERAKSATKAAQEAPKRYPNRRFCCFCSWGASGRPPGAILEGFWARCWVLRASFWNDSGTMVGSILKRVEVDFQTCWGQSSLLSLLVKFDVRSVPGTAARMFSKPFPGSSQKAPKKPHEKLTKRSSSKRPASARSARARAARDPPHSQS